MTRSEMELLGFKYVGTCQCDGTTNFKYLRENHLFYIRPKRQTFHHKENNKIVAKNLPLTILNETIKNIFPQTVLEGAHPAST